MKLNINNILIAGLFTLMGASCSTEETYTKCDDCGSQKIIDITQYGLKTDGSSDCSDLINQLIADLPAEGGVVLLPEGKFRLDEPIRITRNFVTLKGVEGSQLIVNNSEAGVQIPRVADVDGRKNRISGAEIQDLYIVGQNYQSTGVFVEHDNDRVQLKNITVEKCNLGFRINSADAIVVSNCRATDVTNGLEMNGGIQNSVTDCVFGAKAGGVVCRISGETNHLFSHNELQDGGDRALVMNGCNRVNVADCEISGHHVGVLELDGSNNLVTGNTIIMNNSGEDQLAGKTSEYGAIRVGGSSNNFTKNTINCDWNPEIENPVTIAGPDGNANRFSDCTIANQESERVFYISESTEVLGCVEDLTKISYKVEEKNLIKAAYLITYDSPADIEDDDEKASYTWFKREFVNGVVLTKSEIATTDLSQFEVVWVHIDRMDMPRGWQNLPAPIISDEILNAIKDYYYNGGKLLLTNHATQLIVPLGRTEREPTIYSSAAGGSGSDVWSMNANIGMEYDHSNHPIFAGMPVCDAQPHPSFALIGLGHREDHNCMWDLNTYNYPSLYPDGGNTVNCFQMENDAVVLATWGQVTDWCCAGIVEFNATEECKGTCIAVGLAAYEWNQNGSANTYQNQIILLTKNMFSYLANLNE